MESYLDIVPDDRKVELKNPAITYPFELDTFQKVAQYYIECGENVMVTAHTSAGKTVVAESGIAFAKQKGKRAFYTSPIKTLSNQKYSEFSKKFGDVGLLTGDIKCNPDAQCLIMTTEILRNMLQKSTDLSDVECVIFDEVHYVNNLERGCVWEQCFIQLPRTITLILLSATVSEAEKFAQWIGELKQRPIHLITTLKRPVPLNHYVFYENQRHLILDHKGQFHDSVYQNYIQWFNKTSRGPLNLLNPFVHYLNREKLTPAIFFIFSRKKCYSYANKITVQLVDRETSSRINHKIDYYLSRHSIDKEVLDKVPQIIEIRRLLIMGIGVHHSGLLPILKEITELLFAEGLLKVLFATETFAVGVNMPTRTVVFTELTKFCDGYDQPRMLKTDEYLQMSGRAGRRGLDTFGTVIHLPLTEVYDLQEVHNLMLGQSACIDSKFRFDYPFVLQQLIQKSELATHSYLKQQTTELLEGFTKQQRKLTDQLTNLKIEVAPKIREQYTELKRLQNELQTPNTFGGFKVKLSKNQEKKLRADILKLRMELSKVPNSKKIQEDLEIEHTLLGEIDKLKEDESYHQALITQHYEKSLFELINMGYVDDHQTVTHKGVIASQIATANEILLTELILTEQFTNLDLASMAAVLSIFCDDSRASEETPDDLPREVYEVIDTIHQMIKKYQLENVMVTEKFAGVVYLWIMGSSYLEIAKSITPFEGDFIRSMLKLSHLCDELIGVCNIIQNPQFEKKLLDIKGLLVRDLVTSDSLYLKL